MKKVITQRPNGTLYVGIDLSDETHKADQSFRDQANINAIVKRFDKGLPLPTSARQGIYRDQSEIPDFQTAMETITSAQLMFNELPAAVRKKFANSPTELLDFLRDPNNLEEGIKLGLLERKNNDQTMKNSLPKAKETPPLKTETNKPDSGKPE